jgi:hypothetical protein
MPASTKLKSGKYPYSLKKKGPLRTSYFLFYSENIGKRDFPADSPRAATNVAVTRLLVTDFITIFTEITIIIPLLIRILNRLIEKGISPCSDNI